MTEKEKRVRILEAARELFLHYGLKKTTISEIAEKAGVGKGTVYLYFETKEEILMHIAFERFSRALSELKKKLQAEGDPCNRLRLLVQMKPLEIRKFVKEQPHAADLLPFIDGSVIEKSGYRDVFDSYTDMIAGEIRRGIQQGHYRIRSEGDIGEMVCYIQFMSVAFNPSGCRLCGDDEYQRRLDQFADGVICMLKAQA